jgi:hypothetical protein
LVRAGGKIGPGFDAQSGVQLVSVDLPIVCMDIVSPFILKR